MDVGIDQSWQEGLLTKIGYRDVRRKVANIGHTAYNIALDNNRAGTNTLGRNHALRSKSFWTHETKLPLQSYGVCAESIGRIARFGAPACHFPCPKGQTRTSLPKPSANAANRGLTAHNILAGQTSSG